METDSLQSYTAEHEEWTKSDEGNSTGTRAVHEKADLRGSFPAMAVHLEWPELEQSDPLVWPEAWYRPPIPNPLAQYFDQRSAIYEESSGVEADMPMPEFALAFQKTDITYSMYDIVVEHQRSVPNIQDPEGKDPVHFPPQTVSENIFLRKEPEIRMFGTNATGNSVCVRYRGFLPYFYVEISNESMKKTREFFVSPSYLCTNPGKLCADQALARMECYMQWDEKSQEEFRMASMHVEPLLRVFRKLVSEMEKTNVELQTNDTVREIYASLPQETKKVWEECSESMRIVEKVLCELLWEYLEEDVLLQPGELGNRGSVCCPHWTRLENDYSGILEAIIKIQPPAYVRLSVNKARGEKEEHIYSFVDFDQYSRQETGKSTSTGAQTRPEVPLLRCKMCHELLVLSELLLQSVWQIGGCLYSPEEREEYSIRQILKDMDAACRGIVSIVKNTVYEPIHALERQSLVKGVLSPSYNASHVSRVDFEDFHRKMEGYTREDSFFLRIELFSPRDCTTLRTAIQYAGLLCKIGFPHLGSRNDGPDFTAFFEQKMNTDWITTYESNVPFVLRFMIDHDITGMGWVYVAPRAWTPVPVWDPDRKSKCQIEAFIDRWQLPEDWTQEEVLCGKDWEEMAPLIYLFFDDEMAGKNPNKMPSPSNIGDMITQSGCLMFRQYEKEPFEACVFSLGGAEPLLRVVNRSEEITDKERDLYANARIFTFGSECDLLLTWRRMVEIVCPDFLGGYNSIDFDLPYMVRRSTTGVAVGQDGHLGFRRLSKVVEEECMSADGSGTYWKGLSDIRQERFQSKGSGLRENEKVGTTGIVQFDVLRLLRDNVNKRSYKLSNIAEEMLDMGKIPLPHYEITPKATSPYDVMRSLLDRYCLVDALLPKLAGIDNQAFDVIYTEMARISGVPMEYLLSKGQRIKVSTILIKYNRRLRNDPELCEKICHQHGKTLSYLMSYTRPCPLDVNPSYYDTESIIEGADDDDQHMKRGPKYSGATVLKAKRGYYLDPTPTLDFSSLYPNIQLAFNIGFTTYMGTREDAEAQGYTCAWDYRKDKDYRLPIDATEPEGDFIVTLNNAAFIKRHILVASMAAVLGDMLEARGKHKKKMALYDKGSVERGQHDGAQLGLKKTANSTYGYTAGTITAVSAAITSMGSYLLKYTRDYVYQLGQENERYANEQLYGDTDSIMFRLLNVPKVADGSYDMHEAAQVGIELAQLVTDMFQRHGLFSINLAFEKVYKTFMLKSKKCYAVYKLLFDVKTGKLTGELSSSGMETIRRDSTLFTKETLETAIKMTMEHRDLEGAIAFVQAKFSLLKDGRVPMDKLIKTGKFTKRADQYVNPVPHIEAVRKQMMDDPNKAPTVGSRIEWVIVKISDDPLVNAKSKVHMQAVMPDYKEKFDMVLDYDKYFVQCARPFCRFFAPALSPKMNAAQGQAYVMRTMFEDYFREQDSLRSRQGSSLIAAFARQNMRNPMDIPRSALDPEYDKTKPQQAPVGPLCITMDQALSVVDTACGTHSKRKRRELQAKCRGSSLFTVKGLTTTEESVADWMASVDTDKKGRKFKKKRGTITRPDSAE